MPNPIRFSRIVAIFLFFSTVFALWPGTLFAQRQIRMAIVEGNFKSGLEAVGAEYEKLHPGVKVSVQIVPGDGYATWIRAAIAGGPQTAPDIFNINFTSGYFESGRAISLTPYLEAISPYSGKPWIESFYPEYIEMSRAGSDYPQVPLSFVEIGFFYNKSLFDKAGVEPPDTWSELIDACEKLQSHGIIPLGIGGNLDSYWSGTVGWLVRVLCDAYYFDTVPLLVARSGDFAFDPDIDGRYVMDPEDPYCDLLVNIPIERILQAILDGDLRFDGPRMREIYTRLREFAEYWQRGYNGAGGGTAAHLFFTRKSAMMLNASPAVSGLEYDMLELPPEERFDWGIFRIPRIDDSELVKIHTRGAGGPMPVYGIVRKSKEQQDLAADFLMFLMRPESCQILVEHALKDEQAIIGPFAIQNAPLPPGMAEKYEPFFGLGREKLEFRGLRDEQESVWRWSSLAQDYMAGRIPLDRFLEQYQLLMVQAIPRVIKVQSVDMDARTRNNNGVLVREIESLFEAWNTEGAERPTTPEAMTADLARSLRELARATQPGPNEAIQLVEEKTIPFRIVATAEEFDEANVNARAIAEQGGFQYLVTIRCSPSALDYRVHDFRPTYEEVIARIEGRRYGRAELDRIWRFQ